MKILCVANEKGGTGKTTVAVNLGLIAVHEGQRTLLIDADPQASAFAFYERRRENEDLPTFQLVLKPSKNLHKDIQDLGKGFDLVLIDVGGRDSKVFRSALLASDYILIPVQPSQLDLWGLSNTLEVLEEAQVFKRLDAKVLLNMVPARARVTGEVMELLQETNIPTFTTTLGYRVAFREAITQGLSILELAPKSKAAQEVKNLWKEVKEWLGER